MEADHAHWHKTALSMRLPLGMRELFFLPALSWLPGHPPARHTRSPKDIGDKSSEFDVANFEYFLNPTHLRGHLNDLTCDGIW